jgi:spoIIIJ-associated protein
MDEQYKQQISKIINNIVTPICGPVELEYAKEGDQWRVNVVSPNGPELFGYKGELLNALQHLIRVLIHKQFVDDRTRFLLDVGMTRHRREDYINKQIPEMAKEEVLKNGTTYIVQNLSSYERRIIHGMLAEVKGLETLSVGDGYSRKLLIRPTTEIGSMGMDNSKIIDINAIETLGGTHL